MDQPMAAFRNIQRLLPVEMYMRRMIADDFSSNNAMQRNATTVVRTIHGLPRGIHRRTAAIWHKVWVGSSHKKKNLILAL